MSLIVKKKLYILCCSPQESRTINYILLQSHFVAFDSAFRLA